MRYLILALFPLLATADEPSSPSITTYSVPINHSLIIYGTDGNPIVIVDMSTGKVQVLKPVDEASAAFWAALEHSYGVRCPGPTAKVQ